MIVGRTAAQISIVEKMLKTCLPTNQEPRSLIVPSEVCGSRDGLLRAGALVMITPIGVDCMETSLVLRSSEDGAAVAYRILRVR